MGVTRWVLPKIWENPQIIHFNRVFHYKPSILGYPYFWKHPGVATDCLPYTFWNSREAVVRSSIEVNFPTRQEKDCQSCPSTYALHEGKCLSACCLPGFELSRRHPSISVHWYILVTLDLPCCVSAQIFTNNVKTP